MSFNERLTHALNEDYHSEFEEPLEKLTFALQEMLNTVEWDGSNVQKLGEDLERIKATYLNHVRSQQRSQQRSSRYE